MFGIFVSNFGGRDLSLKCTQFVFKQHSLMPKKIIVNLVGLTAGYACILHTGLMIY